MERNRKLAMLALVLLVIVPLTMAPKPKPEKIKAGPINPIGYRGCISPLCGGWVIEERDGSDTLVGQVAYGTDGPVWQILADGSSQYLHEDPRGNITMLTEGTGSPTASAGDVLERVTYDPFGKPVFQDAANVDAFDRSGNRVPTSAFSNTLLFGGHWYDPETGSRATSINSDFGGFYAMGGRYLNSNEGRVVSRPVSDKIHEVLGAAIAGHAPVNLSASSSMPSTREHILLGRQVGVPASAAGLPTGKRQHKPFTVSKATSAHRVSDITLKRGVVGAAAHGHLDYLKKTGDPATAAEGTVKRLTDRGTAARGHGDITLKRGVVGADDPGHADYVKNMVTGAAQMGGFPSFPFAVGGDGEDIGDPPAPVGGDGEDIGAPAAPDGGVTHQDDWQVPVTGSVPHPVILAIPTGPIPIPVPPFMLNVGGDGEDIGDNAPPPGIEHEDIG